VTTPPRDAVRIEPLRAADAGEALTVQRAAYVAEAQRYGAPRIPPLVETLDELRADLADPRVVGLGAWLGPRLVGSVRGRPSGERMEVVRLAVAPDMQGNGVGRRLLCAVEAAAPQQVRVLWLVTGADSQGNLRLYARAGYLRVSETADTAGVRLVLLERRLVPRPVTDTGSRARSGSRTHWSPH
jgi:ribosomal protein S18 acetylase RimI-like enzyme